MTAVNTNKKNTFVVDTSFVLAYLLPDEGGQVVEEMLALWESP